jgi:hypothetical protein
VVEVRLPVSASTGQSGLSRPGLAAVLCFVVVGQRRRHRLQHRPNDALSGGCDRTRGGAGGQREMPAPPP